MPDLDPARGEPLFKRVVIKLSGEDNLMGPNTHGLDMETLHRIAGDLKATRDMGVQVAVVVGGGNFFRGIAGADKGIERARADSIGMLATVMNALAMEGALEEIGQPARVLSAVAMPSVCQPYCVLAGGARPSGQAPRHSSGGRHWQSVLYDRYRLRLARRRTLRQRRDEGDFRSTASIRKIQRRTPLHGATSA